MSEPHNKTSTPFARAEQVRQTVVLYLQGLTQAEIGQRLGVSKQQISYNLKKVQAEWAKQTLIDLDRHKMEQLAKIDLLEREAWAAWDASKGEQASTQSVNIVGSQNRRMVSRKVEHSHGNPAYWHCVMTCVDRRIKLLGLDAPQKIDITQRVIEIGQSLGIEPEEAVQVAKEIIDHHGRTSRT